MRERRSILFWLLLLIVSVVSGGLSHPQCLGLLVTLKCVCAWGVCVCICVQRASPRPVAQSEDIKSTRLSFSYGFKIGL